MDWFPASILSSPKEARRATGYSPVARSWNIWLTMGYLFVTWLLGQVSKNRKRMTHLIMNSNLFINLLETNRIVFKDWIFFSMRMQQSWKYCTDQVGLPWYSIRRTMPWCKLRYAFVLLSFLFFILSIITDCSIKPLVLPLPLFSFAYGNKPINN